MNSSRATQGWQIRFVFLLVAGLSLAEANSARSEDGVTGDRKRHTTGSKAITRAIKTVLSQQADAWNRGDIGEFMEHYWKSDELTFSSAGKTTRGWTATKANYHARYPTREQMGRVAFSELEVYPLGKTAALVLGRWRLDRRTEPIGGNFSLVFRRVDQRWVIIHDHTSRSEPAPRDGVD